MENQEPSSDRVPKGGGSSSLISSILSFSSNFISYVIDHVLTYYAELISNPFKSGLVYFAAGIIGALFVGWILFPIVLYSEQKQPVDFSHAIHTDPDIVEEIQGNTELDICLHCHGFREDGSFAGIPKLETCMECHDDAEFPLGESPEEERFLKEYVAHEKEIPWLTYSKQPDCVYFSHVAHVKMGNIECQTCHGDHDKMDNLPLYQENRLTGYSINIYGKNIIGYKTHTWDRMKMDDCAECHTENNLEEDNACFVCHK